MKVDVKLQGVQLLLLDDLRASVVPLLRLRLAVTSIAIEKSAKQLSLRLKELYSGIDYLNHRIGSWEPFIERFTVSATYRFDYEEFGRQRDRPTTEPKEKKRKHTHAHATTAPGLEP